MNSPKKTSFTLAMIRCSGTIGAPYIGDAFPEFKMTTLSGNLDGFKRKLGSDRAHLEKDPKK